MVQVTVDLPELPAGKKYTGEYRQANRGEQYVTHSERRVYTWENTISPSQSNYFIVEDIYIYIKPDWMKPGWLFEREDGWWWAEVKPQFQNSRFTVNHTYNCYHVASIVTNTNLEFTPPKYSGGYENSLTQVT